MTIPVLVPDLGEIFAEVRVVRWLKQLGDPVARDEELVEITTEKMDVVVDSPAAGVLVEVAAEPGDRVAVGARLGAIAPGP